jgi:hypothetical protein
MRPSTLTRERIPARRAARTINPNGTRRLGRYADPRLGAEREIIAIRGAAGSTLVIDRLAGSHADRRLIAHLLADEPATNACLMCDLYLDDENRGHCRNLTTEDLQRAPFSDAPADPGLGDPMTVTLQDEEGQAYQLRADKPNKEMAQLRWTRRSTTGPKHPFEPVLLREVVARLENYDPALTITVAAIALHNGDREVSTRSLRTEVQRLGGSPIVLNRRLREAVQQRVATGELTMSEIAIRCQRVKRDRRGNISGETSWLARRIGALPEAGQSQPTPWVSGHVLALIARDGLGISPLEVEV